MGVESKLQQDEFAKLIFYQSDDQLVSLIFKPQFCLLIIKTRLQKDSSKIRERKAPFKRRLLHARDEKAYFPADAAVSVAPWRGRPVNVGSRSTRQQKKR